MENVDIVLRGGSVITMDPQRRILRNAGVAVRGDRIVAVGKIDEIDAQYVGARSIDCTRKVVTPGFVNSHIHFYHTMHRGLAPDNLDGGGWSNYVHEHFATVLTEEDEVASALLTSLDLLKTGTTTFLAAGSYFPDAVIDTISGTGLRGFEGRRTYDQVDLGHDALHDSTSVAISKNRVVMEEYGHRIANGEAVQPCVNVVGLGRVTDELFLAAKELADEFGAILNFHECAFPEQVASVARRTGKSPIKHLYDLGILGPNVVLAHMVNVSPDEIALLAETGSNVAHNPGTALKLIYGLSKSGKFPEMIEAGVNVALGTDAADCANFMDMVRAMYLAAVLFKDIRHDPNLMGVEKSLEMATINGAKALGLEHEVGSVEVGKKADLVLFDADQPEWQPLYNEAYNLVLSASGQSADTVIVDGEVLMSGREVETIDEAAVVGRMRALAPDFFARSGVAQPSPWPIV